MKKKLLTTLACVAMFVVGAIGVVGCCDIAPDTINPFAVCKETSIEQVTFTTEDDVKIVSYIDSEMYEPTDIPDEEKEEAEKMMAKTYVLTGTASEFSQEQAEAYGDPAAEGKTYVVLTIGVHAGQSYKAEWVDMDDAFSPDFSFSAGAKVIDTATDPTNSQLIVKVPESGESILAVEIDGEAYFLFVVAE